MLFILSYVANVLLPRVLGCNIEVLGSNPGRRKRKMRGLVVLLMLLFSSIVACKAGADWKKSLGLGKEKVSYLDFYFHDIASGTKNATALIVAMANTTITSSTFFGMLNVVDDPLTQGRAITSKVIGRMQGIYASASQTEFSLFMGLNFLFTTGELNGSTLTMIGRNPTMENVREMSIVGGSGAFRLARGFLLAKTYSANKVTRSFVLECDVTVIHY
ncbi:hypothetical protein AMTRI_Chr09g41040 [Amborella trichopoda]